MPMGLAKKLLLCVSLLVAMASGHAQEKTLRVGPMPNPIEGSPIGLLLQRQVQLPNDVFPALEFSLYHLIGLGTGVFHGL